MSLQGEVYELVDGKSVRVRHVECGWHAPLDYLVADICEGPACVEYREAHMDDEDDDGGGLE